MIEPNATSNGEALTQRDKIRAGLEEGRGKKLELRHEANS